MKFTRRKARSGVFASMLSNPRPSGGTGYDPGGVQESIGNRSAGLHPKTILKTWPVWAGKFPCCRRQTGFIMLQTMTRVALEKQF
jgi:hypothetical protein